MNVSYLWRSHGTSNDVQEGRTPVVGPWRLSPAGGPAVRSGGRGRAGVRTAGG